MFFRIEVPGLSHLSPRCVAVVSWCFVDIFWGVLGGMTASIMAGQCTPPPEIAGLMKGLLTIGFP